MTDQSELHSTLTSGVATLTLHAPARRNALTGRSARSLSECITELSALHDVGAIVIAADGPAFCAGADRALLKRAEDATDLGAQRELDLIYELFNVVASAPVPTISAVTGAAVGAGLNLALAADACIVASDATLRSGFVRIGIHPGGGHHMLLRRLGGAGAAAAMAVFDQPVTGARAVELGLAWEHHPRADVVARAQELAAEPAADPELARLIVRTLRRTAESTSWLSVVEAERGAQAASLVRRSRGA
jgi:enoyl-CoA hydratase